MAIQLPTSSPSTKSRYSSSICHRLRPRQTPILLICCAVGSMLLFYLLLSLTPCMAGANCYHGYSSRFSFDADKSHHPQWMADIADHVALTSLSVPGTHDTMTYQIGTEELECQIWDLKTQLTAGLRYFDIRARLRDDELYIYHGDGFTGFSFQDVLLDMFHFLDSNPSETIIMRLKQEGPAIGHNNTRTFEEAFNYARTTSPVTSAGAEKHLALYDGSKDPLPTLGALRSKIFILQQFDTAKDAAPYGLEWEGKQMVLEDFWIMVDRFHLPDKFTAIRDALDTAATAAQDNSVLYLSHISASVGVLPIEAAAGPLRSDIGGMNDLTGEWLQEFAKVEGYSRTGVVIFDFPGKQGIEAVLEWNKKLK